MRGSGASFSGERADEALKDMRSKVSSSGEAGWKAPVPKSHKEEVGAAFQSAHNSSGWDRKARWQRAVNLAKAKMGISGPDESIDKWGPASKDGAAAEDPDRRRASTPLNRRGSMTGVPDGLGGLGGGRGGVHGIAELRTPVALKEHLKRGKGVRESGGGIQLATLEVAWEAPLCEEDAAALVEKWENRRQMLGAAPMSPSRGPLMSPADRALRAWTNNNTPGSGTDNSGGPGTPASGGAVAASSNNSPAALTAAAAAAGRGIVQLRRFSETGSASVAGSGGSFPSMRRSGVFDSIIARRQPQLLEGAAAGGPGVGGSPGELAAGGTAADGSPVRYASPVHRQDSGGAGGGLVGNSAPGEMDTPRMRLRISADGGGGRGPPPLMAPPTFGRQRLQPLAAEGSGLNLGLGASPPLPPIPPPIVERSGSIQRELSLGGEPSELALRTLSAPVPEAPPPAPVAQPQPPALMPVPPPIAPPALQLDSPSGGGGGGGAGGRRHRMSRTSLPGDVGGLPNSSSSGAPGVVGLAAPTSASLPSPLPTLPDEDCPVPVKQEEAEPGPPPPAPEPAPPVPAPALAPAPPRLTSANGPLRPTAPASPSLGRYSTSGAPPHPHPHGPPHGPLVPPSPPRQHSPAAGTARRSSHQAANLVLAAAGGGGGGGMAGGGLNVQGTGLSMRPGHNLPHPLQHVAAAAGGGGGFSGGGSPALGSPASSSPMRLSHANLPPRLSVNGNLQSSFGSTGSGGGGGGGAAAAGPMAVSISAFGSGGGAGAGAATPGTAGVTTGGSDYCLDPAVSSPAGSGVVPPLPLGGGGHRQPAAAENLLTGLRAVAAEAADEMVREAELAAAQRAAALSGRARAAAATAGLNTNLNGLRMSDAGSASGRGARLAGAPQFPGDPWRKFN